MNEAEAEGTDNGGPQQGETARRGVIPAARMYQLAEHALAEDDFFKHGTGNGHQEQAGATVFHAFKDFLHTAVVHPDGGEHQTGAKGENHETDEGHAPPYGTDGTSLNDFGLPFLRRTEGGDEGGVARGRRHLRCVVETAAPRASADETQREEQRQDEGHTDEHGDTDTGGRRHGRDVCGFCAGTAAIEMGPHLRHNGGKHLIEQE